MRVAVLHNPRPIVAPDDTDDTDDTFEEFDSADTIEAVCGALSSLGVEPVPIVADRSLPERLSRENVGFAFNMAEGSGGRCREAIPAAICELLSVPYTGSDPLTLAVTLDKAVARRLVSPEIPVAKSVLITGPSDLKQLSQLKFPVIVKPNHEGSSKGLSQGAVCQTSDQAASRCNWLTPRYGPALVEEFLPGQEVTVAVRGNSDGREVLGMMGIDPIGAGDAFVYDLDAKRNWRRSVRYVVPPRLPADALDRLQHLALLAFDLLGCRDIARLDFRFDAQGRACFLECNPLPGLSPTDGDLAIMTRGTLRYVDLVQGILIDAARREGIRLPDPIA